MGSGDGKLSETVSFHPETLFFNQCQCLLCFLSGMFSLKKHVSQVKKTGGFFFFGGGGKPYLSVYKHAFFLYKTVLRNTVFLEFYPLRLP